LSAIPVTPEIETWETAYRRFETPREEIRKFIRRLQQLGADEWPRHARIVDLFCGRGNGLVALERLGFTQLLGVDLSPRLVALHRGGARCSVGDCRELPIRTASHDIAVVQGGLHHLPTLPADLERVSAEVQRVLRPGGLFVIVEPWRTPFLDVVHNVGCSALGRRLWGKMDALATMIEQEGDTYQRWLREPALISDVLRRRFEPAFMRTRWGKLLFVGRRRA
jgi:SAM-dependent methyltransferase